MATNLDNSTPSPDAARNIPQMPRNITDKFPNQDNRRLQTRNNASWVLRTHPCTAAEIMYLKGIISGRRNIDALRESMRKQPAGSPLFPPQKSAGELTAMMKVLGEKIDLMINVVQSIAATLESWEPDTEPAVPPAAKIEPLKEGTNSQLEVVVQAQLPPAPEGAIPEVKHIGEETGIPG